MSGAISVGTGRCYAAPDGLGSAGLLVRNLIRPQMPSLVALEKLGVLETRAGVENDHLVRFRYPAGLAKLARHPEGAPAFGTEEKTLALARELHPIRDLLIADRQGSPPGLTKGSKNDEISKRLRDADSGGERPGVGPRLGFVEPLGERIDDRRAAARLRRDEPWFFLVEPADRAELVERLPHADEADAATGRVHDHVGHAPPELFGELEPHRLLALDAIRLPQRRRVVPTAIRADPFHDGSGVGNRSGNRVDLASVR